MLPKREAQNPVLQLLEVGAPRKSGSYSRLAECGPDGPPLWRFASTGVCRLEKVKSLVFLSVCPLCVCVEALKQCMFGLITICAGSFALC